LVESIAFSTFKLKNQQIWQQKGVCENNIGIMYGGIMYGVL